eukprot:8286405-Pyramimonas_sp.AAC.1
MMGCLASLDVGSKSREQVNQMPEKLNQMDEYQVQDVFPMCKIEKAYKGGQGLRDPPEHHAGLAPRPEDNVRGPSPSGLRGARARVAARRDGG